MTTNQCGTVMARHYKIRLKPELYHRRKNDSVNYYQYNIKDRISKVPFGRRPMFNVIVIENLPFQKSIAALRQYYLIQQIICYFKRVYLIQKAVYLMGKVMHTICQLRLYSIFVKPIINLIDSIVSIVILYPLKYSPTCRTVSIRDVKHTTLLPITTLLKPFHKFYSLIRREKSISNNHQLSTQRHTLLSTKPVVIFYPVIQTALLINSIICFIFSMICLYVSLLSYWIIKPRFNTNKSNTNIPDQQIRYDNFMTVSTPRKFVSIKWSCEILIHSNNLPTFNLYPKYRLKPKRTYVHV